MRFGRSSMRVALVLLFHSGLPTTLHTTLLVEDLRECSSMWNVVKSLHIHALLTLCYQLMKRGLSICSRGLCSLLYMYPHIWLTGTQVQLHLLSGCLQLSSNFYILLPLAETNNRFDSGHLSFQIFGTVTTDSLLQ